MSTCIIFILDFYLQIENSPQENYYSWKKTAKENIKKQVSGFWNGSILPFQGQEGPLEKEMATHSSILAWEISWTEEPGRLQSTESQSLT